MLEVFSSLKYLMILNSFFCHNYNMVKELIYSIQAPGKRRKLHFYRAPNLMNFKRQQQADLWTGYFSSSFHLFSSIYFSFIRPPLTTASQHHLFSLHFRTMIIFMMKKLVNSFPCVIACFSSLFLLWIIKFCIVKSLYLVYVHNKGLFINWKFWYIVK